MNLNRYQQRALETAVYPSRGSRDLAAINYTLMGLGGEVGEIQNKFKKILRGDKVFDQAQRLDLAKELGGVLWYTAALSAELGFLLEEIANGNLIELSDRKARGVLQGDGDSR